MKLEKLKNLLKNKKAIVIAGLVIVAIVGLGLAGYMMAHSKNTSNDKKITSAKEVENKEEDKKAENEAKKKLEDLKKIDISKLSDEDKKATEEQIKAIEEIVNKKEYAKVETEVEALKKNIDSKIEEVVKKEEITKQEESKKEEEKKNQEVASNTTENSTSDNTSSNNGTSGNTSNVEVKKEPVQQTPPVVAEEKPVVEQPTPQVTPPPAPVEEPKPTYPTVEEVKQRLIAYGQSLGLTYDPSINESNSHESSGTQQMWDPRVGTSADQQTLFNGLDSYAFNVEVVDLGEFCSMKVYGIVKWD